MAFKAAELFGIITGKDLGSFLQSRGRDLQSKVVSLSDEELSLDDDTLREKLLNGITIEPLEVDFTGAKITPEVKKINLPSGQDMWRDDISSREVDGLFLSQSIPFSGNKELWFLRPEQYFLTKLPSGNIQNGYINLQVSEPISDTSPDRLKSAISEANKQIRSYIEGQSSTITNHNQQMQDMASSLLSQERQKRNFHKKLINDVLSKF